MKTKILEVTSAEYKGDFKIKFTFSDGKVNTVDFKKFIFSARNPMITKYQDEKLFKKFSIEDNDISWNDMEMSFSLDDIYSLKIMK